MAEYEDRVSRHVDKLIVFVFGVALLNLTATLWLGVQGQKILGTVAEVKKGAMGAGTGAVLNEAALADLEGRIAALSGKLDGLKAGGGRPAAEPGAAETSGRLAGELASLSRKMGELGALRASVDNLEKEMASLRQAFESQALRSRTPQPGGPPQSGAPPPWWGPPGMQVYPPPRY